MERLLLLWDEIDELVSYGRHFVVAMGHSLPRPGLRLLRRSRALNPAPARI